MGNLMRRSNGVPRLIRAAPGPVPFKRSSRSLDIPNAETGHQSGHSGASKSQPSGVSPHGEG